MLNEQKSLAALCFFIIIDTVPTGGQVYVVVIPGGFGPDWGGQMKKFLRSLMLAMTPLHKSVNFYPAAV